VSRVAVATAAVVLLALVSAPQALRTNIAALAAVRTLASADPACRVDRALCVAVASRPDALPTAEALAHVSAPPAFRTQALSLLLAAGGRVTDAERQLSESSDRAATLNLGRLYWSLGRDDEARAAWRDAGSVMWLALLLDKIAADAPPAAARDVLVTFVSEELPQSYDEQVLAGIVTLRLGHGRKAFSHFQRALTYRPGDRRLLFRLAQAYGSSPRAQLARADHAAAAAGIAAALRFDPDYADLHLLLARSSCLGNGDYVTATRAAQRARDLGYGELPADLTEALTRQCAVQ
jgi:tetratricopeptide (TPR) repeat protein